MRDNATARIRAAIDRALAQQVLPGVPAASADRGFGRVNSAPVPRRRRPPVFGIDRIQ